MKKLKITSIILLISILISTALAASAFALDDPSVDSNAAVLCNADTGAVLFSKNADDKAFPASTTKIMTVLLAIEEAEKNGATIKLSDNITVADTMTSDLIEDGSSANLQVGETMSLENLLYCAMLSSGNDACNVIAEYVGGSISSFVDMMNARAQELGCTGTHFSNPHGIPAGDHYTTAQDLARIALEASQNATFMTICSTAKYTVPATNMSEARNLSNSNALINADSIYGSSYVYDSAAGMKTGHTEEAGYCLVSSASKDNKNLIAVVLGGVEQSSKLSSFTDSITLYNWAFDNFSFQEILKSTENVGTAPVSMGDGADSVSLRPQSPVTLLLPNDADLSQYTVNTVIYCERDGEKLVAPIAAGEILGEVTVSKDGQEFGKTSLVASGSVDLSRTGFIKAQIHNTLTKPLVIITIVILAILFILYLTWVAIYRIQRRRHIKAVRQARKAREMAAMGAVSGESEKPAAARNPGIFSRLNGRSKSQDEEISQEETYFPDENPPIEFDSFDDEDE